MYPDLKTWLAKMYLGVGSGLCVLFIIGALSGWKLPQGNASTGRAGGGFWGVGK
ncbi:MAG: hypothetical protein R3C12_04660 [Planctomycetaceae bacterium]|nr:hypothetical protein [Planctomycetaceae bacterium]